MDRSEMLALLSANTRGVMATTAADGSPHVVPMLYALDGETILSSGTEGRVRTRNLERDPRCTVTVFDEGNWFRWVTVKGMCEIRRANPVEENERLYAMITGHPPEDLAEYREAMVREQRIVYAITIERWYPSS
jgi:PPOX class probable F420-dependent enzyme